MRVLDSGLKKEIWIFLWVKTNDFTKVVFILLS